MTTPRFIIYTPSWIETGGGVIALHSLCARLNALGIPTALWPDTKPCLAGGGFRRFGRYWPSWWFRGRKAFSTGPFPSTIARERDLAHAIVLYPEIIIGNPLGAARVARWFLHRPGEHTGITGYGLKDLYFHYADAFRDTAFESNPDHLLRVTYINGAYRRTNFGARAGSCYIVRKGVHRALDRHPVNAVAIDGMTHEEKAAVFNRVALCYSYDPYTMYTLYAVLCGCTSVYIPEEGVAVTDLWPGERPPGLAYGEDDLVWAERTRDTAVQRVENDLAQEDAMVRRFADTCSAYFDNVA